MATNPPEAGDGTSAVTAAAAVDRGPEPRVGDRIDRGTASGQSESTPDRGPEPVITDRHENVGKDRPLIEPDRYIVHREDSAALGQAVDIAGRDEPSGWIQHVNPRFEQGAEPFQNNCGECSRAFAITTQIDRAVAAAGDRYLGEQSEMWEWAGVQPANTLVETDTAQLGNFQSRAWDHVAKQLNSQPPGTVAVIGIDWAPLKIGDRQISQGGHWFNAYVSAEGLKWVDAQDGTYRDWPPDYPSDIVTIESIYRPDGQSDWRT